MRVTVGVNFKICFTWGRVLTANYRSLFFSRNSVAVEQLELVGEVSEKGTLIFFQLIITNLCWCCNIVKLYSSSPLIHPVSWFWSITAKHEEHLVHLKWEQEQNSHYGIRCPQYNEPGSGPNIFSNLYSYYRQQWVAVLQQGVLPWRQLPSLPLGTEQALVHLYLYSAPPHAVSSIMNGAMS
jgi:hypothetical protein